MRPYQPIQESRPRSRCAPTVTVAPVKVDFNQAADAPHVAPRQQTKRGKAAQRRLVPIAERIERYQTFELLFPPGCPPPNNGHPFYTFCFDIVADCSGVFATQTQRSKLLRCFDGVTTHRFY
jgi:hypothetical protein